LGETGRSPQTHIVNLSRFPVNEYEKKANLPFVLFPESPEAAIAAARRRLPAHAEVLVFPFGGSTYPIL